MPLFEYRCHACAHLEEVLQKHSDPAPEACPSCGRTGSMAKAISLTSFQLKGGGWYRDLYASQSAAPAKAEGATGDAAKAPAASATTGSAAAAPASTPAPASKPAEPKASSTTATAA